MIEKVERQRVKIPFSSESPFKNKECVILIISFIPRVILPLFNKHHGTIDKALDQAANKTGDLFDKAMEKAKDYAAEQQLKKD